MAAADQQSDRRHHAPLQTTPCRVGCHIVNVERSRRTRAQSCFPARPTATSRRVPGRSGRSPGASARASRERIARLTYSKCERSTLPFPAPPTTLSPTNASALSPPYTRISSSVPLNRESREIKTSLPAASMVREGRFASSGQRETRAIAPRIAAVSLIPILNSIRQYPIAVPQRLGRIGVGRIGVGRIGARRGVGLWPGPRSP